MARATSSLPTPLSPWMSTVALGRRGAAHGLHHLADLERLAHHLVLDLDGAAQLLDLVGDPAPLEGVADRDEDPVGVERLVDEVEGAAADGLRAGRAGAVPGDHDDRHVRHRLEPLQHVEAVHAGHLDVEEDEVGRLALEQGDAPRDPTPRRRTRSPRTR